MANSRDPADKRPFASEPLFPLSKFKKVYPYAPGYRQLWRYARIGVAIRNGRKIRRVKLEVARLPGGLATSVPAFKRFIAAIQDDT